jgi:ParB family chromosome partitioning protein
MDKKAKRGLGRGLSALMADVNATPNSTDVSSHSEDPVRVKAERIVPVSDIYPNPDQPRRQFDPEKLDELTSSIRAKGVIQPLIVRERHGPQGKYEIVAGERRWRASQNAQVHELPIVVREFSDTEVLEIAIIENIQRADLNPIEEAAGYRQLMDKFGHTQEKMAEALGKSRSHIANLLRLLNLPQDVQSMLTDGSLSMGHARALITSDHPTEIAKSVVSKGLSVRDTERLVKKAAQGDTVSQPKAKKAVTKDADTAALEGDLSAALKLRVSIDHKPGHEAGSVTIHYKTLDDLDDLCRILTSTN